MNTPHITNITLVLALGVMTCTGCSHKDGDNEEKKITPEIINVIKVSRSNPGKTLRLPAELLPFNETGIYARVNGYVKNVLVDRGTVVKKGQLLIAIDAPELEAQLSDAYSRKLSAEATYKISKLNYRRLFQTSATQGAVSPSDLDQSGAKMYSDSALAESARSNYQSIKEMKNYLHVEAPFNGIITERNVSPGALVGPNGKGKDVPMLVLKQEDRLRLTVAIPEAYTGQVMLHKEVSFSVKTFPDKKFNATLARRAGGLTTSIRAEMVEFDVENKDNSLKSGMYAEIDLEFIRPQASLYVPKTAIVSSTEKTFVIRCINGIAQRVPIQKGNDLGNLVEIFGNINEGDLIVEKASDEIQVGKKLDIHVR